MSQFISTTRRQFLTTTLGSAALLCRQVGARELPMTRWAFLSDTHVPEDPANEYRGFRPYENLRTAVSQVAGADLVGAIITGDAARREGLPGDYRRLKALFQPLEGRVPVSIALGNTDNRSNFHKEFSESHGIPGDVKDRHVRIIEAGPVRFVLLDSLLKTSFSPGFLGKIQRTWLEQFLGSAEEMPTLLFVHHTLDDTGKHIHIGFIGIYRVGSTKRNPAATESSGW